MDAPGWTRSDGPPINKLVTRLTSHCLSVVDCRRSDNIVYAFAMLLAFAPPDYYLSHAPSKCKQTKRVALVVVLVNRVARCSAAHRN